MDSTNGHTSAGTNGNHLEGMGGVPTVVIGPGAGAGSAVIIGTDNGFRLTVTAGAGTAPNAIICTITFNSAFSVIPNTVFSPKGINAAAANARHFINNLSTSQLTLNITNPGLTTGLVYIWSFITI